MDALRSRISSPAVDRLDLATDTPRHFGCLETAAISTPEDRHTPEMRKAIADSDVIVARVLAADALVVGIPICNFGMLSTLKAFFDHVSRNGQTLMADKAGMRGLLGHKRAAVLIAAGGACGPGEMLDGLEAPAPRARAILGVMGIADPAFIAARPMMFAGQDAAAVAMRSARAEADSLAARWADQDGRRRG